MCQFLLYNKVNQLYIYICPHISSLLHLPIPPSLSHPSRWWQSNELISHAFFLPANGGSLLQFPLRPPVFLPFSPSPSHLLWNPSLCISGLFLPTHLLVTRANIPPLSPRTPWFSSCLQILKTHWAPKIILNPITRNSGSIDPEWGLGNLCSEKILQAIWIFPSAPTCFPDENLCFELKHLVNDQARPGHSQDAWSHRCTPFQLY